MRTSVCGALTCARPDIGPVFILVFRDHGIRRAGTQTGKREGSRSIGGRNDGLSTSGASHCEANLDIRHGFAAFVVDSARDP